MRSEQRLRSPDIYGDGTVIREVYSLRGLVRPGNSGGPIVDSRGHVAGVVFAASVTDAETGYALTVDQVAEAAARRSGPSTRDSCAARPGRLRGTELRPCPCRALGISLPCSIAFSGGPTCLTFLMPTKAEQRRRGAR